MIDLTPILITLVLTFLLSAIGTWMLTRVVAAICAAIYMAQYATIDDTFIALMKAWFGSPALYVVGVSMSCTGLVAMDILRGLS